MGTSRAVGQTLAEYLEYRAYLLSFQMKATTGYDSLRDCNEVILSHGSMNLENRKGENRSDLQQEPGASIMMTYLFDASAAVELYVPRNAKVEKAVRFIVDQKRVHKQAALYIPNFCVVEVFNTLARKRFKDGILEEAQYEKALRHFRDDVHWGRILYSYDLNRYHVIGADEIIPIEHHVASDHERDHLSTFDILIIAMACELAYVGRPADTFLVTCDRRIQRVVEQFNATNPAERKEWKIPSPMLDHSIKRWVPPNPLYLPALKSGQIRPVQGQASLNL